MSLIDSSGERGIQVAFSYTKLLTTELAADGSSMQLENNIFQIGNVATIGAEDILITSRPTVAPYNFNITRAQNGTAAAIHSKGQVVRLRTGATVFTKTFDNAILFSSLLLTSDCPAIFRIKWYDASAGTTLYEPLIFFTYNFAFFSPSLRYTPGLDDILTVEAWVGQAHGVCGASIHD